jgi:hypothetical protein
MARRVPPPLNPSNGLFIHEPLASADPNCSTITFIFWGDELHVRPSTNTPEQLRALLGRLVQLLAESPTLLDECAGLTRKARGTK